MNNCHTFLTNLPAAESSPPGAVAFPLLCSSCHPSHTLPAALGSTVLSIPSLLRAVFPRLTLRIIHVIKAASQASHTGFFHTFSCHVPSLEFFFKSVFRVLCAPPKRHIHGPLLSTRPEVSQTTETVIL